MKLLKALGVFLSFILISLLLSIKVSGSSPTKSYGWGYKLGKPGEKPDVGALYESIIKRHNAYYMDDNTSKKLYLTFDAGYENGNTPKILDVLKKYNVPATFFLVGDYLKKEEALVKRMVKEGHIVGNHTWSHPDLTKLDKEAYKEELQKFEDYYQKLTGKKPLKILRPPAGTFSDRSLAIADELGYYTIFWSVAYKDWEVDKVRGWEYAYNSVMRRIHPGAIILLHSVSKDNADALERIIVDLQNQGYEFAPITDLFIPPELFVTAF
ncbi:MAG: delta-lactam-biosynthetic de-N-acetylase [Bacilli bacterium]|nr:delta-lactam-biosynthetic de-N-acetylase [Bacilli bacterium]